ncbi:hypothetical protein [Flavobacterium sp.]|uniref:hypothetical protein n=1 Tax=Flavobacterium sp. TaxID=239 RepID=UPI003D114853
MRNFTLIFLFLILICFYSCAEFKYSARRQNQKYSIQNCKEIYGKWESLSEDLGVKNWQKEHKLTIWIFNGDGTLVVDNKIMAFKIEDDCSKLIIGTDSNFYEIKQTKDTLYLLKRSNYSIGSYSISLKKIN